MPPPKRYAGEFDPALADHAVQSLSLQVTEASLGLRLDNFIRRQLAAAHPEQKISRERIKGWIRDGLVALDGRICREADARLQAPGGVRLNIPPLEANRRIKAEAGQISLLYQDDHLLVLNKPAGLTVHPAPSCPRGTLLQRLLTHFPQLRSLGGDGQRPGIVHRLDKETSGLLVVALQETARLALADSFAERAVGKIYLALVWGCPQRDNGEINLPLGRHPSVKTRMAVREKGGRAARSVYKILYKDPAAVFSLLAVRIYTGRTHQIRVHLSSLGCPIIGDKLYGSRNKDQELPPGLAKRQMLHAWAISFRHPQNGGALRFACPPPKDFEALALYLSRKTQRLIITGMPGCGKSSLLKYFQSMGLAVFSADQAVRELYDKDGDGRLLLRKRFGDRFAEPGRPVDRRALLKALLEGPELVGEINRLIHPLVFAMLEQFWRDNRKGRLAVAEIPLYFESGSFSSPQRAGELALTVRCPLELRRRRLEESRGWSREMLAAMEAWQWPEEKKSAHSDLLLDNDGSPEDLTRQGAALLETLRAKRIRETLLRLSLFQKLFSAESAEKIFPRD